ncbi:M56 family metallopeptidase [Arthrobacter sp. H14]|uniref:M56 family metallopeptidase n=1 Tax=Arthrobacter sp. H14 TaxID=1312959 RepID=UPI0004B930C2|nr:M56 family metallopeptidase [Arthrobacter sp. H14]
MTAPIALIVFVLAAVIFGPRLLRRLDWLSRAPRMGILAWQALSASVVLAVVLAGLSLAVPAIPWTTDVAALIEACAMALRAHYSTPGGAAVSATGAVLALAVIIRVGYCLFRGLLTSHRTKKHQLNALVMVAQRHQGSEALVVDHPSAAAYCLPGRHRTVVFTTAALEALDKDQFAAVLAHERAHLRGHHHLILAAAEALQRSFPRLGAFRTAHTEVSGLVEMLADDNAVRSNDRFTVATALVRLAERGAAPSTALSAGGDTALFRVRRLVAPANPLGPARTMAAVLATTAVIILPLLILAAPAATASQHLACPIGTYQQQL